jgi:hypothetical protein
MAARRAPPGIPQPSPPQSGGLGWVFVRVWSLLAASHVTTDAGSVVIIGELGTLND